jgi:hypothetical protein
MNKKYQISSPINFVQDEARVKFHIESADYFGTIATVLTLLKHQIKKNGFKDPVLLKTFSNLEKDLLFLQKNYQICYRKKSLTLNYSKPKIKNKNKIPKGKLKSQ